jgi:hypothetical protein
MTKEWYLRDFILDLSQKWYLIVLYFAIGSLIGWGVSYINPTVYRADLDLYVGINPYRSLRDRYVAGAAQDEFRNIDDYKNWQMEQLNTLALGDAFLSDTLGRLQVEDLAWADTSVIELRTMLDGSWRNAGRWHLSAEALHPVIAKQAVTVWGGVIDEHTQQALEHARQLVAIDSQLTSLAEQGTALELRSITLTRAQEELLKIQGEWSDRGSDRLLTSFEYWQLTAYVAGSADRSLGWENALEAQPALDADLSRHQMWLDSVLAAIANDLDTLPDQIALLKEQHADVADQYAQEAELSLALSANLDIEMPDGEVASVEAVRPTNLLMLLGGFLGLLGWLFWKLARFSQGGAA